MNGVVVLVTGATRGIGKGIAAEFGRAGATVYITGRTLESKPGGMGGLKETAEEITALGGKCIPVQCDHASDEQVDELFEKISADQSGRLDVLINNAYAAVDTITSSTGQKFYENPIDVWDTVNNVGLRNHYRCAWHASQLMIPRNHGLIVNISSPGGLFSIFNTAYGIGKDACDRMAVDCGKDLRKKNVTFVSAWPGAVRTEKVVHMLESLPQNGKHTNQTKQIFEDAESPSFVGKVLVAFFNDPKRHSYTGKVVITKDLANKYGMRMEDGSRPTSIRWIGHFLRRVYLGFLANFLPAYFNIPRWVLWLGGNRIG